MSVWCNEAAYESHFWDILQRATKKSSVQIQGYRIVPGTYYINDVAVRFNDQIGKSEVLVAAGTSSNSISLDWSDNSDNETNFEIWKLAFFA